MENPSEITVSSVQRMICEVSPNNCPVQETKLNSFIAICNPSNTDTFPCTNDYNISEGQNLLSNMESSGSTSAHEKGNTDAISLPEEANVEGPANQNECEFQLNNRYREFKKELLGDYVYLVSDSDE